MVDEELRAKVRQKALAKRKKLGRKLTLEEYFDVVQDCMDAQRSKKNGSSLSKNPPHP